MTWAHHAERAGERIDVADMQAHITGAAGRWNRVGRSDGTYRKRARGTAVVAGRAGRAGLRHRAVENAALRRCVARAALPPINDVVQGRWPSQSATTRWDTLQARLM